MLARRRRRVNVSCLLGYESTDQQTRDAIPIPVQCWARVTDPGPTPAPANVTCSLGMHGKSNYGGNDYTIPVKRLVHSALTQRWVSVIDSGPAPIQSRANKTVCRENTSSLCHVICGTQSHGLTLYCHLP